EVVEKLMQKAPTSRYVNCTEVIEALRPFAGISPAPVRRATMAMPRVKLARPEVSRPALAAPPVAPSSPRELSRPRPAPLSPPRAPASPTKLPRSEHGQKPAIPAPTPPVEQPTTETPAPTSAPLPQRIGTFGTILLAALAGIAGYFLISLIQQYLAQHGW